ncbi:GNAT family N-acetyltransferase [Asticcacaulis tiandongensis]|uniref:GNAT family N-acetyltransferase n=1 Tax=Asticcacaulis tiandongensis TaxID=2565365 RepID=UPI001128C3B2|nr:GNAT family N-acetyltransferase [Asticcacaulis tiandongensis]
MTTHWRQMGLKDIDAAFEVAAVAHESLPERREIFAERLSLFPKGCLVLETGGRVVGYALSHPIKRFQPPALDSLLGQIAPEADDYYIHDVAILPEARGGQAQAAVRYLLGIAADYESASLVSVYGTAGFWGRFGFEPAVQDMTQKLAPYGDSAVYMLKAM